MIEYNYKKAIADLLLTMIAYIEIVLSALSEKDRKAIQRVLNHLENAHEELLE